VHVVEPGNVYKILVAKHGSKEGRKEGRKELSGRT